VFQLPLFLPVSAGTCSGGNMIINTKPVKNKLLYENYIPAYNFIAYRNFSNQGANYLCAALGKRELAA
jgi:hypothetical protein